VDDFDKKWDWKAIPAPPSATDKQEQGGAAGLKLLVPFVVAGLIWLWGKPIFAAIVAGIGALFVILKLAAPSGHQILWRVFTALGIKLGSAVSFTALTVVYALFFVPAGLAARLLRRDALGLRNREASSTYWLEEPAADPVRLFDRPFLMELRQGEIGAAGPKPLRLGRALYHTTLTLFVLNLGIGYAYHKWEDYSDQNRADWRSQLTPYEGAPWVKDYFREYHEVHAREYWPYVVWKRPDYQGQYINIERGRRKTYRGSSLAPPKLKLYTFGASTTWGTGARDDHTIPSYIAKFAERDGIPLEVTNFGESAYVNWQSMIKLAEQCAEESPPDFVTFYEGAADLWAKLQTPEIERVHQNFSKMKRRIESRDPGIVRNWFEGHSLIHILGRKLVRSFKTETDLEKKQASDPELVQRLSREFVMTMEENARFVAKLGEAWGFETWFFWQPLVYTKKHLSREEEGVSDTGHGNIGFGTLPWDVYRRSTELVRSRNFAIDLTEVFDGERGSIYIDWAHVSERGNELVAERVYETIKPALERRAKLRRQEASR
jgi:hypothetical protein